MLSGKTIQTMADIARNVEAHKNSIDYKLPVFQQSEELMSRNHLAKAAVSMAISIPAKAIITSTKSGDTAQICASYRGKTPIFALSESARTVRELSLSYGVHAEQISIPRTTDSLVKTCLGKLLDEGHIDTHDLIVFIGGGHIYSAHTNFLQVDTPLHLAEVAA